MRTKAIDYDALFKDFLGDFFPDFVAFVNPELFAAIDWAQGCLFLEQELINALRGKFKIHGKRRHTDKLVKVQLLNGDQHFIFVHIEFQHQAEKGFALRMFLYRALIQLRYGLEDISAYAMFTGAPPPEEETLYLKPYFWNRTGLSLPVHCCSNLARRTATQLDRQCFCLEGTPLQFTAQSLQCPF